MSDERKYKDENYHERSYTDISELNNFPRKNTHFSIESSDTKPYDISKMTGKPTNQGNNNGEE